MSSISINGIELIVHFAEPDEIGHKCGWYSKEYNAMCDTIDFICRTNCKCN